MTSYTITPSIEQSGMFVFSSKDYTSKPFYRKEQAYSILLNLVYDKIINPSDARKLSQKIYNHDELQPIPIVTMVQTYNGTAMVSTDDEYMVFIFNVTMILDVLESCKTFPNLFEFTTEFGERLAWLVIEKPSFTKENGVFLFSLVKTYSFDSKKLGIDHVIRIYDEGYIDLLTQEYLFAAIEKSSVPDIADNILN